MTRELTVILYGQPIGAISTSYSRSGRPVNTSFSYDEQYRRKLNSTPLSVTFPLQKKTHTTDKVLNWLWGLLPDNEAVIRRWAQEFKVSALDPLELLSTPIGLDCAGAVQFVKEEAIDDALNQAGSIKWLSESEFEEHLTSIQIEKTNWNGINKSGRFSLGGAQAKTALVFDEKKSRWGIPLGSHATTHIVKPGIDLETHQNKVNTQALNEHLCMSAAKELGFSSADTSIIKVNNHDFIVIKRYDRINEEKQSIRIHQEDLCQALGLHPIDKYENSGGPGVKDIAGVFDRHMNRQIAYESKIRLLEALAFNWVIGGTDAHSKNYSLLLIGSEVRLAPLYDIASSLPYWNIRELRFAMRIGKDYRVEPWSNPAVHIAQQLNLDIDIVLEKMRSIVESTPEAFEKVHMKHIDDERPVLFVKKLIDVVNEQADRCSKALNL